MRKFAANRIGIDQGETEVFSEFKEGGPMWTGSGPRERRCTVKFSESFLDPPAVQASVTLWDVDSTRNLRAQTTAEDVTRNGCTLVVRTWSDSRIARLRMGWMAIGPVRSDEDWDV